MPPPKNIPCTDHAQRISVGSYLEAWKGHSVIRVGSEKPVLACKPFLSPLGGAYGLQSVGTCLEANFA